MFISAITKKIIIIFVIVVALVVDFIRIRAYLALAAFTYWKYAWVSFLEEFCSRLIMNIRNSKFRSIRLKKFKRLPTVLRLNSNL